MPDLDARQIVRERAQRAHPAMVGLSHWIHARPETNFNEHQSSAAVADALRKAGFEVTHGAGGLETAVVARFGSGPLHVALIAEYDALPEVGHACGHNVIAASAVGAGIALAGVADQLGLVVSVIGTPAEEGGGGKITMLDAGVFDDVHFALMAHPGPTDLLLPDVLAAESLIVSYRGQNSHAASFPELGINAGDALVVAQVAIALLRQRLLPTDRVHGIVTQGGEAPNIIPENTRLELMIRALSEQRMGYLREQVMRCFEAGALASGAALDVATKPAYREMRHDLELAGLYRRNAELLGRTFAPAGEGRLEMTRFSSDIGNLSQVVPAIHPVLGIGGDSVNHQPGFTAQAASESADDAILDASLILAWTAIDAALDEEIRDRLTAPRSA